MIDKPRERGVNQDLRRVGPKGSASAFDNRRWDCDWMWSAERYDETAAALSSRHNKGARMRRTTIAASTLTLLAGLAAAQDSVALTPGGNDALSAYDASSQRTRYVVDGGSIVSSWGADLVIAPLSKASRDVDPMFRTHLLGSTGVSAWRQAIGFPSAQTYALWTMAGQGVNPTENGEPGDSVGATGFASSFVVGLNDMGPGATNVVGLVVGQESASRFFVERVVAASSRASVGADDTSVLSLGGLDVDGHAFIRADAFEIPGTVGARVVGQSAISIDLASRGSGVNTLTGGGSNAAADAGATSFVVNNGMLTLNAPSGVGGFAVAPDFAGNLTIGQSTGDASSTTDHVADGLMGVRGNLTLGASGSAGGDAAAALIARDGDDWAQAINYFGLDTGAGVSVATDSASTISLPSPITGPGGFVANVNGQSEFLQYNNQTGVRGPAGQVGVGQTAGGDLVLAATATDPKAGDYIAVATVSGGGEAWTVAARDGQGVLDGAGGASVGALESTSPAWLSTPAVDLFGNVYFVASWRPTGGQLETGFFKAVRTGAGQHELELLVSTGDVITGANSQTDYEITSLTLADADSIASGGFHGGAIVQQTAPGIAIPVAPSDAGALGGAALAATIRYDRGSGVFEEYDAILFVGPDCAILGDTNGDGLVNFTDLNAVLAGFGSAGVGLPGDVNGDEQVNFTDLNIILAAFGQSC